MQQIQNANILKKTILYRADLNLPVNELKEVTDFSRLDCLIDSIKYMHEQKAKIILCSHFGRPKGKDEQYSLLFLASIIENRLKEFGLSLSVSFLNDCVSPQIDSAIEQVQPGDILLLENVRFYSEENQNDNAFAQKLAQGKDVYVNDAFSCAHRAHASIAAVTNHLPSFAGFHMQREIDALESITNQPKKPIWGIIGGAKISSKIGVLENLIPKMDGLLIGGAMANVFLKADGIQIGKSLCDEKEIALSKKFVELAKKHHCKLILPIDVVTGQDYSPLTHVEVKTLEQLQSSDMILDIGPETLQQYIHYIRAASTILWNGPMGAFELDPFASGTIAIAEIVANLTQKEGLISIAGGGDTLSAINLASAKDSFTYCSTAGGAFLEWLEGKELPGIAALR